MRRLVFLFCLGLVIPLACEAAGLHWKVQTNGAALQVFGEAGAEWRFQVTTNFAEWRNVVDLGTMFSDGEARPLGTNGTPGGAAFYRAVKTEGLFDPQVLREVRLYFTNSNWQTRLVNGRLTGSNTLCTVVLENGLTNFGAGARYKGNTSYELGGNKKSINLELDFTNETARLMGYRTVNLNNAAGDETIMREPVYFNVMSEFAPCPKGTMARVFINDSYWGVYSLIQQENSDLIREWFPSNDGDRWRTPNFMEGSAFNLRGTNVGGYRSSYQLMTDNSTNAWERLVNAIVVLNSTPTNQLRDKVEDVLAVDRWLWFLVLENVFADEDSYVVKGSDYSFYYEPESGRMHPIQHDGNEAFFAGDASLSPVMGANLANRPILYRLLRIPELRQRYLAHMRTVLAERFNPEYLTPIIERHHQQSVASIIADPKKNFTMLSYSNDLRALKAFVTNRHRFLTNHSELRPPPPVITAVNGPATEPSPLESAMVTASVQADGTNGIGSVWLYWRDRPFGKFASREMFDNGQNGDGEPGDGVFGGATAVYPAGNKIHYYVEARSANPARAAAFSPARAEQQTYSYRVGLLSAPETRVVINEIQADNTRTIRDPQGGYDDWIEMRNVSTNVVDLSGHYLSDDPSDPRKWRFPEGTTIEAEGYLLVWADDDEDAPEGLHASFRLAAGGEKLLFCAPDDQANAVLDSVEFGLQERDASFGRSAADADVFQPMRPSPAGPNF